MRSKMTDVRSQVSGLRCQIGLIIFAFMLTGCVVRTYPLTRDRVDQDINAGNKGYLQGSAPASSEVKEKKETRTTQIVEIELHSPIKFEKAPKLAAPQPAPIEKIEEPAVEGNKGYITQSIVPEISESGPETKYTVKRGDTLQKISRRFYGTTKRWKKIFNANQSVLKGADRVYPGQTLSIPDVNEAKGHALKEPKENLK